MNIVKVFGQIQNQDAVVQMQIQCLQGLVDAGPGDAQTAINFEQGVVGGTVDKGLVEIEKLVFLPVEIGPGVRAAVDISAEAGIAVYHEDIQRCALKPEFKCTAARIIDFTAMTEAKFHLGEPG